MANQNIPNDPYDPYRSGLSDEVGRPSRFDTELQADPELDEGPASSGKIALFALGIALVLGAVFYGLNNTSVHEAQTAPPRDRRADPAGGPAASGHARRDAAAEHLSRARPRARRRAIRSPPQSSPQGMDKQ